MRSFIIKLLAFGALQVAVLIALALIYDPGDQTYHASTIDKHGRLERLASLAGQAGQPGRRLILVGGSNLSFCLRSELIRDQLDVQPVNMAVQASLGLEFILREVEGQLGPSDVVVVSLEYAQYFYRTEEILTLARLLEQRPESRAFVELDGYLFKMASDRAHDYVRHMVRRTLSDLAGRQDSGSRLYSRGSFNEYGDMVAHLDRPPKPLKVGGRPGPDAERFAHAVADRLDQLHDTARRAGARVLLFHPPVAATQYDRLAPDLAMLTRVLDRDLDVPQLDRIDEMRYPDALFFDTVYHCNREGATRRTELLIERLRGQL